MIQTRLPRSITRSRTTAYAFLIVVLLGALCLIGLLDSSNFQRYYLVAQLGALGVGILHVWLSPQFGYEPEKQSFGYGLSITFLLALLGAVAGLVLYFVLGRLADRWLFVTSLMPFIIPFLFVQAFRFFLQIPPAEYKKWHYPLDGHMPDLDLIDLSKIIVIQFEFPKKETDPSYTNFKAKAPVAMTLGELFLVFMNDYNERTPESPIQFTDETGRPYGWVFHLKAAWWKSRRYIDPDLTFQQNALLDNDTLIAQRTSVDGY